MFCGCKSPAEQLLELNLWPATPSKPTIAFTIELMTFVHMLTLECQASLYDISTFLKVTSVKQAQVGFLHTYFYTCTCICLCLVRYKQSFMHTAVFVGCLSFLQDKEVYKQLTLTFPQYRYYTNCHSSEYLILFEEEEHVYYSCQSIDSSSMK